MEEKVIELWRKGHSVGFICKRIYGKVSRENQYKIESIIFEWTKRVWKGEMN